MSADADALVELGKVPNRVSIRCQECRTLTRVYRTEPTTQIGAFKFCPVCGNSRILAHLNSDDSEWELLAVAYHMSEEAVRAVYSTWNPHEYYRFSDYIDAIREEARTGQPQPHKPYPYRPLVHPSGKTPAQIRAEHPTITTDPPKPLPKMRIPTRG